MTYRTQLTALLAQVDQKQAELNRLAHRRTDYDIRRTIERARAMLRRTRVEIEEKLKQQ